MNNRKGLIRTSTTTIPKKSLNINIEINNQDMWFINVTTKLYKFKMPCRLDSMMRRFNNHKDSWGVVVLGKWVNSDGKQFINLDIDMEMTKYVLKLLELQPDIDRIKLKTAIEAVSKISELSIDQVAKIAVFNLLMPEDERFKGDTLEMYREIYRTYERNK